MCHRHSRKMIAKLESAGLGFHVKANETMKRLGMVDHNNFIVAYYFILIVAVSGGGIPFRHLIYQVHDLPPGMKSLVYDFGQLDDEVENLYISEIVKKHVS